MAALVAACAGPISTPSSVRVESSAAPSRSAEPGEGSPAAPSIIDAAWARTDLTDVATGESFRIADLGGRVVIVEPMAIWCVKCLAQQREVYAALAELDPELVSYILIDVDPNETAPALAEYRSRNGFTGTYVVAGSETARALAADFGDQVLNPPSTPMILIGTDGRITMTDLGHKSAGVVAELARDHGA